MGLHWEKLFGQTDAFGIKLAFADDPLPDNNVSKDLDASWGYFAIYVQGKNLTLSRDSSREYMEAVHWYLLPLFEWLVEQWDPLFHEERFPLIPKGSFGIELLKNALDIESGEDNGAASDIRSGWWERHALISCREGGILPNIVFRRFGESLEISWDNTTYPLPGSERNFVESRGVAQIPVKDAAEVLYQALGEAIRFLKREYGPLPGFNSLEKGYNSLTKPERLYDRYTWLGALGLNGRRDRLKSFLKDKRLGKAGLSRIDVFLGFHDLLKKEQRSLIAWQTVPSLLFRCLRPDFKPEDVINIRLAAHRYHDSGPRKEPLFQLARYEPCQYTQHTQPWRQGYELALTAREFLQLDSNDPIDDMEAMLKKLGIDVGGLDISDQEIRALSFAGPDFKPAVFINTKSRFSGFRWAKKMDLAHELCHLLFDQEKGRPSSIISGPWAPETLEQRANAFAAMFLIPEPSLSKLLGPPGSKQVSTKDVRCIMEKFGTGALTTTWHLRNLGWLSDIDHDWVLSDLVSGRTM